MKNIVLIGCTVFISAVCSCINGGSPEKMYQKGIVLAKEGEKKKAFNLFKNAAKKSPDSTRYLYAAAKTAPDQNTSFMYTKLAWEKGLKNKTIFITLLDLSFHTDKTKKLAYALSLFNDLPDSLADNVFKGDLFYKYDQPDSAYTLWKTEFEKTEQSYLCYKIANALTKMGKGDEAVNFLYQCKKEKTIDSDGLAYLASLLAIKYSFRELDILFSEIKSTNYYNDQLRLEYATYCAFNNRLKEALDLISMPAGPGSRVDKANLNLRFRTLKMYIALVNKDTLAFKKVLKGNSSDTLFKRREDTLFNAVRLYIENDTSAYTQLKKAIMALPPDPVTLLFCTDAAVKRNMYKEAASMYTKLPGIVLWSPRIVVSRARALALAKDDDEALKVVSYMHKHRVFTRPSLELFRNITLKKDLVDKSKAAQQLLEKQYSSDIGLKWKGLLLAIKSEQYDSALIISNQLHKQFPKDERFFLTELKLLIMNKNYKQVLEKIASSTLPKNKTKPIEAAAYKGLGDTLKAIKAYESFIEGNNDPMVVMQLAEMYFQKKMYTKAQKCYTRLIKEKTDSLSKDTLGLAILLNNNAWTVMTAGAKDLSGALSMAQKAYEIAPDNLHILDTYVSILYAAGKYKESISIIEKNKKAMNQKRLLCHLAKSYEGEKNINKAKRYYEDALKVKKEDQKLSLLMSDEQIKNEINRLSQ